MVAQRYNSFVSLFTYNDYDDINRLQVEIKEQEKDVSLYELQALSRPIRPQYPGIPF